MQTTSLYYVAFVCSFAFLTGAFQLFLNYQRHLATNNKDKKHRNTNRITSLVTAEKQLSWFLTFISSLICTIISAPFVLQFFWCGFDMALLVKNSSFHQIYICFFLAYLMLDLALGSIYYPRRISLVTGWIHHIFYIILLSGFLYLQIPSLFTVMSILELPTLVLAAGSIAHSWRSDTLFGSTFFILRIVLHAWMTLLLKENGRYNVKIQYAWIVGLIIYPLHLYWFKGYVQLLYRNYHTKQA